MIKFQLPSVRKMRSFQFLFIPIILMLLGGPVNAQVDGGFQEAKLLTTPKVSSPKEAKESNLGGRVVVRVTVDQAGKVVSVDDVVGPGAVCPSVQTSDVVAIRKAATVAAMRAKFSPALANNFSLISSATIEFDFPMKKDDSKSTSYAAVGVKETKTGKDIGESKNLSGGALNGKALELPKPVYPQAARAVKASGTVPVQVLILE